MARHVVTTEASGQHFYRAACCCGWTSSLYRTEANADGAADVHRRQYGAAQATAPIQPTPEPDTVVSVPGWGYIVPSASTPGAWYMVRGETCSCPAGAAGRMRCRHRSAVDAWVREQNAKHRRPRADDTSEATRSRFVD